MNFLITAIGSMSAETVITGLIRVGAKRVIGCNMHPKAWTAASRLLDNFYQVPPARQHEAYIKALLDICKCEKITHIIPLTDPEIDILTENNAKFAAVGIILCISPATAIKLARNKFALHQFFHNHSHIQTIPSYPLTPNLPADLQFPILMKPKTGRSSEGLVIIADANAWDYWFDRLPSNKYMAQPKLDGDVFVTDIVIEPSGVSGITLTRQELLRTPNGAGLTVKIHPDHPCDALAMEIARKIGLHGCVNIEFLVSSNQIWLMDVNPRFSAGVAFSVMAGHEMVANHINCFTSQPLQIPPEAQPHIYTRGLKEFMIEGVN